MLMAMVIHQYDLPRIPIHRRWIGEPVADMVRTHSHKIRPVESTTSRNTLTINGLGASPSVAGRRSSGTRSPAFSTARAQSAEFEQGNYINLSRSAIALSRRRLNKIESPRITFAPASALSKMPNRGFQSALQPAFVFDERRHACGNRAARERSKSHEADSPGDRRGPSAS